MSRRSSALEEDDKTPRQRLFFREKTEGEREREREKERKRETHRTFCFFFVRKLKYICQKCVKNVERRPHSSKKILISPGAPGYTPRPGPFESMDLTTDGEAITCSCSDF